MALPTRSFRLLPRAFASAALVASMGFALGACSKAEGPDALEAQADRAQNASRLEGAWAIDGQALLRQELGDAAPDVAEAFMDSYRVGYTFKDGTASYRVATPGAEDVLNASYEIVDERDDAVLLRVFAEDEDMDAQALLGDATHFEIRFDTEDTAEFIAWYKEPRADGEAIDLASSTEDDEELARLPLQRLSAEAYDAHFVIDEVQAELDLDVDGPNQDLNEALQANGEADEEFQQNLVGYWVLDAETTAQNMAFASKDIDPFFKRFTPLFMHFDADGNAHGGEIDAHGKQALSATFRVQRLAYEGQDRHVIEFSHVDDAGQEDGQSYMRVASLAEDLIVLDPVAWLEHLHTQDDSPVFQRVDKAAFDAYVNQDPNAPQVDEKAQKAAAKDIAGIWLLDVEKTFEDEPDEMLESFQFGFVIQEDGQWIVHGRFDGSSDEEHGKFTVLDAQEPFVFVALRFGEESLSDTLIAERTGKDTLEVVEPINEYRSPSELEDGRMYFTRVDADAFEQIFADEDDAEDTP